MSAPAPVPLGDVVFDVGVYGEVLRGNRDDGLLGFKLKPTTPVTLVPVLGETVTITFMVVGVDRREETQP